MKLALDHTLIGGITGWAELLTSLDDYCCNWYLGPDVRSNVEVPATSRTTASYMREDAELAKPKSWPEAVRKEVPNLFSLGYNAVKVCKRGRGRKFEKPYRGLCEKVT